MYSDLESCLDHSSNMNKGKLKITALRAMILICIMELISFVAHPRAPAPFHCGK